MNCKYKLKGVQRSDSKTRQLLNLHPPGVFQYQALRRISRAIFDAAPFEIDGSHKISASHIKLTNMVLATLLTNDNDALCITQPSPMTSFDWSDFPLVHQFNPEDDECINLSSDGIEASRAFAHQSIKKSKLNNELCSYSSIQRSLPSLTSSFSSITSTSSTDSSVTSSSDRRLSFAPRVEVREYDLVIGDHPSCDLLPLSLGWTYSESSFQDYKSPNTRRHGNQMKLTYLERKNLLQRVGGYSEGELQCSQKNTLHHVRTTTQFEVSS